MTRRLLLALDVAVVTAVVYALTAADCWPPTAAAHLALARVGAGVGAVGPHHPVWGRCVAWFGLNAGVLSTLAGGCAAGLLAWNAARLKGAWGGLVAAALFAFSPPAWRAATEVDPSLFDLSLLLAALAFAGGRHWRMKAQVALAAAGAAALDVAAGGSVAAKCLMGGALPMAAGACVAGAAFAFALKVRRGWIRWGVIGAVSLAMAVLPVLGALTALHPAGAAEDALAAAALAKVGPGTRWLVTDGALEDALARRLALRKDGRAPFLVRTARNFDEAYLSNLVRRVSLAYPGDAPLRLAASLGVRAFLEDLPFVESNAEAVVFARRRVEATPEELARARERLERARRGNAEEVGELIARFAEAAGQSDLGLMRERARELVRADRMNPLGNAVLGTLAAEADDIGVAELHLRRAVARGGVPALVYNDLAEILRRRSKYREAEEFARKALELSPGNWRILETLADILQSREAPQEEVEAALEEAERRAEGVEEGKKATLLFLRAVELLRTGQELRAKSIFHRLRALPISPQLKRRVEAVRVE